MATQQVRLFASDLAQFRLLPLLLGEYTDLSEALRQGDPAARRFARACVSSARSRALPLRH